MPLLEAREGSVVRQAALLKVMPSLEWFDVVYYHVYMGWKINVVDNSDESQAMAQLTRMVPAGWLRGCCLCLLGGALTDR